MNVERPKGWWGSYELARGQSASLRLGPLRLWIERYPGEWRAAIVRSGEPSDELAEIHCPAPDAPPEEAELQRFASRKTEDVLVLSPVLADRSVVTRPEVPFHLLPGDEVEIFVSTAVWVRIGLGEQATPLLEVPTVQSKDTWFGPSTREGELAYASRTAARLNLENVPRHGGRAVTGVLVRNRAEDNLSLERIILPVPALSLFSDSHGALWTETITVERDRGGKMAQVQIGQQPPGQAAAPTKLAEPRAPEARNVLVRALSSLLR